MFTRNWFLLLNPNTEQHKWNCSRQPRSLAEALLTAESVQGLLHQREIQFSQALPTAGIKHQVEQRRTSVAGHLSSDTKKLLKKKKKHISIVIFLMESEKAGIHTPALSPWATYYPSLGLLFLLKVKPGSESPKSASAAMHTPMTPPFLSHSAQHT